MNAPHVRSALAQAALNLAPPLIRDTLLEDPNFHAEYGIAIDSTLSFGDSDISFQRSKLFNAIRKVLAGVSVTEVADTEAQEWQLKNTSKKGELPNFLLSFGNRDISLPPSFVALSPDKDTRLLFLDKVASEFNLPTSASDRWYSILAENALEYDEVEAFNDEILDTPVEKVLSIQSDILERQNSISSLVPASRRYFERLVGEYDGSTSIHDYASNEGRKIFSQLSAWRPYDGFLFSLFLSSHSSLTAKINVDQLSNEDLVSAFDTLDKHGDRISQLGAIEVGFRVLPSRPDIEQALIHLIEKLRDDNVSGQASGFRVLSALFYLVDGELSRTRLFAAEPPFYRRLAALSQAALIHRQLVDLRVDVDKFSEWAFDNRGGYYLQSLADMRLEPHWNPDLATASQMKAYFFGRIMFSADTYRQNITNNQIYDLVLGDGAGSLRSLSDFLYPWFPGPLEGTKDTQNILPAEVPEEVTEVIETQLGQKEVGPSSFIALVNFAPIYRIGTDQAELAATTLKRTNYQLQNIESKPQLVAILDGLAKVASVARSHILADELRILVRKYRHDAEYALSMGEVIKICLVAAASRADLNDWTEFVGNWLTELAFSDLKDDEGLEFHLCLKTLCHAAPELWVSCGRADAALMAFNAK